MVDGVGGRGGGRAGVNRTTASPAGACLSGDQSAEPAQEYNSTSVTTMTGVIKDENGLILPRKLYNPCIVSNSKRDLHREIKWNTDKGIRVLNNKSELEIAFAKHKKSLDEKNKEKDAVTDNFDSEFQKMLNDRAKRLEQVCI